VPPEAASVSCEFEVEVPPGLQAGDLFGLGAYAIDDSPDQNVSHETRWSPPLLPRPAIARVQPTSGGSAGGTEVLITGAGFLPGSRVTVDGVPLYPDGGIRVDDRTFTGRVPAHVPGAAAIVIDTPVGAAPPAAFAYLRAPRPTSLAPTESPAEGGVMIHVTGEDFTCNTRIFLGNSLTSAVPLAARPDAPPCAAPPAEIVGQAPAGQGRVTVWAFDPSTGWGGLPDAFTWLPATDAGLEDSATP
jgi:hypothetical protein